MITNCIIIPVHPPKSNWLVSFLMSFKLQSETWLPGVELEDAHKFKVILATSNFDELIFFQRLLSTLGLNERIEWFCVDSYVHDTIGSEVLLQRIQKNEEGCIVNLKKLLSLRWAAERGFEWALCIDSDTIFVQDPRHLFLIQVENYRKKFYIGVSGHAEISHINEAVTTLFSAQDRVLIEQKIEDNTWYLWFFEPPFYSLADFGNFYHYMSKDSPHVDDWLQNININTFDHIIFAYWRIMHEHCSAIDYRKIGIGDLPESLNARDCLRISERYGCVPAWLSTASLFSESESLRIIPSLKMAYHFDRI